MNKTSDIQEFRALLTEWTDGDATLAQERRLETLAASLSADKEAMADKALRQDVELILSLSGSVTAKETKEFGEFLDSLTLPAAKSRRKWPLIAGITSAAAAVLLFALLPLHHAQEPQTPVPELPASISTPAPAAPIAALKAEPAPEPAIEPETTPSTRPQAHHPKPKAAEEPEQNPKEYLEPREVTDPEEAAEILRQSFACLTKARNRAEDGTLEAIATLDCNLEIVCQAL